MPKQYTRKMIREEFIQMLNEMPLDKITVKDLVIRCDLNRNTFYYYYPDLYAIVAEIFETELSNIYDSYNDSHSWEESFLLATGFVMNNKKAVYHVYKSIRHEEVERYVNDASGAIMTRYVINANKSIRACDYDVKLIASFYQNALSGMILGWIDTGMKQNPHEVIPRIGQLFNGNIALSLTRSVENKNS